MHPETANLALYATGDLAVWSRLKTRMHVRSCEQCREMVEAFRADRAELRAAAKDLPEGLDWDRLAAEMTANVHLGLAAGECVSPQAGRGVRAGGRSWMRYWRPLAAGAALSLVLGLAWWLNMPPGDTEKLGAVARRLWTRGPFGPSMDERGPTVEASEAGIRFRENGRSMGVSWADVQPVTATVSLQGSASAQWVDDDTGQVTITTVYVQ
jgi:hypothetical protein